MAEFSQLVRERLGAQRPAPEHLDPNLLSAFAEGRLSGGERTLALAHLSVCAECREVMAVASQEDDAAETVAAPKWRHGPFTGWRLALVGGLAVLAISATLMLQLEKPEPTLTARINSPTAAPPAAIANEASNAPAEGRTGENKVTESPHNGALRSPSRKQKAEAADELKARSTAAGHVAEQRAPLMAKAQPPAPMALPPPPPPPPQETQTFDQPGQQQNATTAQMQPSLQQQQNLPAMTRGARAGGTSGVVAKSDATPVTSAAPAAPASADRGAELNASRADLNGQQRSLSKAMLKDSGAARWTISPDGKLERAVEAGSQAPAWQTVDVGESVVFRVVNASGADVWAGGNGAALFHSADGGANWARVAPDNNGRKLEGDVISINVAGARHEIVRLRTSMAQSWISSDGGKTWKFENR